MLFIFASLLLSGCATTPAVDDANADPKDPFETINRSMWTFNWDVLDKNIFKPAAQTYADHTPKVVRAGLYNMVLNLDEPSAAVDNLLQLKFADAAKSATRFVLNSTVGILGFFDPASHLGLIRREEEFGEVMATYGVGDGPYLMLPALGPSSVREEVGDYIDQLYWPLALIDFWPNVLRLTVKGLEIRAQLSEQEGLINDAIDPYIFVKNAYFQNMRYRVYDGELPVENNDSNDAEMDSFLDELDGSDEIDQ